MSTSQTQSNNNQSNQQGSLVCVGTGMTLGSHLSPLSRSYIEQADIVFTSMSNGLVQLWIEEMNANIHNLQQYYSEGKSRHITYREMVDAMLSEVRKGNKVVCALYGHPGVFAYPAHKAIDIAKSEGYAAHMEPGISAEDCLYADCGIDPGRVGCTNFEASQFMFYQRNIDTSAYLILWQVGVAGDKSLGRWATPKAYRQLLTDLLLEHYPEDHELILYEAPTLPIDKTRVDKIKLKDFAISEMSQETTMVVPPAQKMQRNEVLLAKLAKLDAQENQETADIEPV